VVQVGNKEKVMRAAAIFAGMVLGCSAVAQVGLSAVQPVRAGEVVSKSSGGYHLPFSSSELGRKLFVSKGCVVCHSIKGVGGQVGPPFDADPSNSEVDAFEFAARMWRGALAMITLQKLELGFQIDLTGQELAHIARFLHDFEAQKTFSEDEVPADIRRMMRRWQDRPR
jgi:mono/diheme cytochrome c family protein